MACMLHCITLHLYCNVYIIWLCINKMARGVLHSLWLCYKTYDHSHFNMARGVLNWVLFWVFKRITTHTRHLSRPWLNKERLALFALGREHMAPHAPNTFDLGGFDSVRSTNWCILRDTGGCWVFWSKTLRGWVHSFTSAKWRTGDNKPEGEKWQRP